MNKNFLDEKWNLINNLHGIIDRKVNNVLLIESINILILSIFINFEEKFCFKLLISVMITLNFILLIFSFYLFNKITFIGKKYPHRNNFWSIDDFNEENLNSEKNYISLIEENKKYLDHKIRRYKLIFLSFLSLLLLTIIMSWAAYFF